MLSLWRNRILLDRDQTLCDSELGKTSNAMDVELPHNALAMSLDSPNSNPQAAGDFLVAQALRNGNQNLAFAIADLARLGALPTSANELVYRHARDIGTKECLTRINGLYGFNQFVSRCLFQHKTARAGLQNAHDMIGIAIHRKDKDLDPCIFFSKQIRGSQPVHARHIDVHQHDIGRKFLGLAYGLLTVSGFANDGDLRVLAQARAKPLAHDRVIVDHKDADRFFASGFGGPRTAIRVRLMRNREGNLGIGSRVGAFEGELCFGHSHMSESINLFSLTTRKIKTDRGGLTIGARDLYATGELCERVPGENLVTDLKPGFSNGKNWRKCGLA